MHRVPWGLLAASLVLLPALASAQDGDDFGPVIGMADPEGPRPSLGPRRGERDHVAGEVVTVELVAGEVLTVGTCGVRGAFAVGDTTLAVADPANGLVARNDDACNSLGSRIVVRAAVSGPHTITLACYSGTSCGGRVVWAVGDREETPPIATIDTGLQARALVGLDGHGALLDGWLHVLFDSAGVVLRLSASPIGVGGGNRGGLFGGAVRLYLGFELGVLELGIGGGVGTLSQRPEGITQREVGMFALRTRIGLANEFRIEAEGAIGLFGDEEADGLIDVRVTLPIESVEITARGLYGFSGVWLGELGVVIWPEGDTRRGVGIGFVAGGGALFYQPVCRFGLACPAAMYAGPHLGLGIHVRP